MPPIEMDEITGLLVTWAQPGSLPYNTMMAARDCTHRWRDPQGQCRDCKGCGDGWKSYDCDCSQCERGDPTKPDLVNPFCVTDYVDQEPLAAGARAEPCDIVACYNRRNGRRCWRIRSHTGRLLLFGFPARQTAHRIATKGGRIWRGHEIPFC